MVDYDTLSLTAMINIPSFLLGGWGAVTYCRAFKPKLRSRLEDATISTVLTVAT